MKKYATIVAAALAMIGASTVAAQADSCSGRDHPTGTILGAVGGGLIGNAASHGNAGGVVAGAVLGGLAGNAIERSSDCHRTRYRVSHVYYDRYGHRHVRYTYAYR